MWPLFELSAQITGINLCELAKIEQHSCQIYLASKRCRNAKPVAFHLELLGHGRQGNNQHRNVAFTQGRIENKSLKAET